MLHVGYEVFHPKPGQFETLSCRVCNTEMDVRRDCYGPTGFAEAMSGGGHLHDSFTCPHAEKDWHVKVLRIYIWRQRRRIVTH